MYLNTIWFNLHVQRNKAASFFFLNYTIVTDKLYLTITVINNTFKCQLSSIYILDVPWEAMLDLEAFGTEVAFENYLVISTKVLIV